MNKNLELYIALRKEHDRIKSELDSIKEVAIHELELLDDKYDNGKVQLSLRRTDSYEFSKDIMKKQNEVDIEIQTAKAKMKTVDALKKLAIKNNEATHIGTRIDIVMHDNE